MIYKATRLIEKEFKAAGLKFAVKEINDKSMVDAGFGVKNGPNVTVHFISGDDDTDVSVRVFGLINEIEEDSRPAAMNVLNSLNKKYRYVKFYVDTDGDVNVEYDLPVRTPDDAVGTMCVEIFIRFMKICEECYRDIMRAIL